jgi:probable HAF family extracellular repeat protein
LVTFVAERADSTVDQWTTSDTNVARHGPLNTGSNHSRNWTQVIALAPGTVTITASRQGDTGHATLVVRQPERSWEAIDLGLLDATLGQAVAVGDDGSVIGRLEGPGNAYGGFIYKNGVMRKLAAAGADGIPSVIGPSGQIVGWALDTMGLVIWDTPDAAPRRLGEGRIGGIIGINERGDVLAMTRLGDDRINTHYRAVLWRDNLGVDLGDLSDSTVTYPSTTATAWNNRGQIVGSSVVTEVPRPHLPPRYVTHSFLWENGVMRDLGWGDLGWGVATGINANGVVVGTSKDAEGRPRAVIWENGVMRDLSVAPGHDTWVNAINDRGQVMGTVGSDGCTTFFWENGQTQIIAPFGSFCPTGLGPNGEVIGFGLDIRPGASTVEHALIWQAGRLIDLGPGVPRAINNRDEVVGTSAGGGLTRPMLWRRRR